MMSTEAASALVSQQLGAGIAAWARLAQEISTPEMVAPVEAAGQAVLGSLRKGSTLLVAGNGGSAAIASHVAAEFLGKCIHDRHPLPAISLAESHSSLTAIGNDYGFDQVFLRGVQAFGRPGDVFLAMSTSGTSPHVVAALAEARARGLVPTTCSSCRPRRPPASRRSTCCGPTPGARRSTWPCRTSTDRPTAAVVVRAGDAVRVTGRRPLRPRPARS